MSTSIRKNRAYKHTDKGEVTQTPYVTTINSKTRSEELNNVPKIISGDEYTLDVGSFQIIADTFGLSFKEQVQIIRSNDSSGDAARGKNATNAALAAMLVKSEQIDLVQIPHQDYSEVAKKLTPPYSLSKPIEIKPLTSFAAVAELSASITKYAAEKIANMFTFQRQQEIKMTAEAVTKHNKKIQDILEDIFDKKLVTARWGAQLASTTQMWGIKRSKDCSLTRQEIIQKFVETDDARYAYACMC